MRVSVRAWIIECIRVPAYVGLHHAQVRACMPTRMRTWTYVNTHIHTNIVKYIISYT